MRIFDLTMGIDEHTPTFPGDPKQQIESVATVAKDGWNEKRLSFNSHFSTHIDAPFHMLENGKKLTDFPIEKFVGECTVIDVRGQKEIDPALEGVKKGDFVFFLTGHINKASSKDFFKSNPVITKTAAEKLISKGVSIIGIDSWTPDNKPYEVHKMLFRNDILIVENLIGLDKIVGRRFKCYIMPLKIMGADGAPCRVIGIDE